ncbi:toll/interleukin-1 receptor domain-containing protein [Micromonospora sp. U56]|uniref:toll/interleukin-1 receptor domain-containing protein n=1 Tax=Micromonospora sp. U56 TaxID=2824900 RepID=UPI001B363EA2|nr:toll/interleukin-1 receptor domain-containing protein [Micromonospora sp. U56]
MSAFVSYSRRDNSLGRLAEIEARLSHIGEVYIDDLHHPLNVDRHNAVIAALDAADVFIAVMSPHYPQTPWTRYEVKEAARRGLPLLLLTETGAVRRACYEEILPVANATP